MISQICFQTPLGPLKVCERDGAVTMVLFGDLLRAPLLETPLLREARAQLAAYFDGRLRQFDLPLAPEGTAFRQRVWQALQEIPYGTTATYGQIAARIGSPKASRAVGQANHDNPIPIIIPCHRVIGASGALTGYAGGLEIKRALLRLEGAL